MTGNNEYSKLKQDRIYKIINNNLKYNKVLSGYYNFISNLSDSSCFNYVYITSKFLNFTNKSIEDIELDDYTNYLSSLKDYTSSYSVTSYSALRKFSTYLFITEKCSKDYVSYIKKPKSVESQKTLEKREQGYLNKSEIKKYVKAVDKGISDKYSRYKSEFKNRDKLLIYLFLNTGIRLSAMYKLDTDSIDFKNKTLIVTDKGSKINKYILSDEILDCANNWIKDRALFLDNKKEDALFISKAKSRMSSVGISDVVKKYATTVTDKKISPHKLRATYGTQIYNATHDIYLTQKAMNHSNPSITELYIRGNQKEYKKVASNIMSNIIFK